MGRRHFRCWDLTRMTSVAPDQDLPRTVIGDVSLSSAVMMDPEVTDRSVTSDPALPERTEDCGSAEVDGTSLTSEAAPPAGMEDGTVSGPGGEDTEVDGTSLTSAPPAGMEDGTVRGPGGEDTEVDGTSLTSAPPAGMEDGTVRGPGGEDSEVDGTSLTSAPPAGTEDGTVRGPGGEDSAAGSIYTSQSLSVANMAGTTASSSRVRRRKSSPKKREMPDDMEFPLDMIVKEEISDEEYGAAINTDASSGADGSLGSGILIAQNGPNRPQWAKQKGRRKKRSPAFQKPLLVKSSADTASLMFVIPNEEMETVVGAKKRRKRKEEEHEEVHWCDICDECFAAEADLEVHMETHLEPPPDDHDCEDCGRVFDSASELEQHRSKKHGKLRYCCDICGIQYNYESQFVIHMRAHSGERPFSCHDCGQVFGHKCSLVIHQRKHTGVTPHQCGKCKKMLDTRVSLAKHQKMRYCADCQKCYTHRSFAKHLIKDCAKV